MKNINAFVVLPAALLTTTALAVSGPKPVPAGGFRSCAQARAAGYHDMRRGEPGYAPKLDRDHDGIACEASRRR